MQVWCLCDQAQSMVARGMERVLAVQGHWVAGSCLAGMLGAGLLTLGLCVGCVVYPCLLPQNVLLQIGLNLLSLDGVAVKSVRQYVLKCDACYEYVGAPSRLCVRAHSPQTPPSPTRSTWGVVPDVVCASAPPPSWPVCLSITTKMDKLFCPSCGNPSLAKLGVTLRKNGQPDFHYAKGRRVNIRGSKYPLPNPKVCVLCAVFLYPATTPSSLS